MGASNQIFVIKTYLVRKFDLVDDFVDLCTSLQLLIYIHPKRVNNSSEIQSPTEGSFESIFKVANAANMSCIVIATSSVSWKVSFTNRFKLGFSD